MDQTPPLRRPTSVPEMFGRVRYMMTDAGVQQALAFEPRQDDVFICPYPKSGTTWLQQIVHTLRTGGDMDFGEITEVVPWLELAHDMGLDIHAGQAASPRAYKSHLPWEMIPKGGRYLLAVRHPADVLVSQYHFWDGWFFETGSVTLEDLAHDFFLQPQVPGSYWAHLLSWWPQRGRDDVLMFCYEDMRADPGRTVERIAAYIGIDLDAALRRRVLEYSSLEFMRAHEAQFDDHLLRETRDAACGIPPGGSASKVRKGEVGGGRARLGPALVAEVEAAWRREITPVLDLASYEELRMRLARGR